MVQNLGGSNSGRLRLLRFFNVKIYSHLEIKLISWWHHNFKCQPLDYQMVDIFFFYCYHADLLPHALPSHTKQGNVFSNVLTAMTTVDVICYKYKSMKTWELLLKIEICKDKQTRYINLGVFTKVGHWDFEKNQPKSPALKNECACIRLAILLEREWKWAVWKIYN